MKKSSLIPLTESALIASIYLVLTVFTRFFGIADGGIQFRLSEALSVLPLFTPYAVPGLTLGCFLSSLGSPYGIFDAVVGTFSTFLAAVLTRWLRKITFRAFPLLSFLAPALVNGIFIGLMLSFLTVSENPIPSAFQWTAFFSFGGTVALGELVVCFALGVPLYFSIKKINQTHPLFSDNAKRKSGRKKS